MSELTLGRKRALEMWVRDRDEFERCMKSWGFHHAGGNPIYLTKHSRMKTHQPARPKRHGGRTSKSWRCKHGPGGPRARLSWGM